LWKSLSFSRKAGTGASIVPVGVDSGKCRRKMKEMSESTSRRGLAAETAKFFRGTPESRLAEALRLDPLALDLFLAGLPEGTSREEAARRARLLTHAGRRTSRVMEQPRG
jgi:hypothetical protein